MSFTEYVRSDTHTLMSTALLLTLFEQEYESVYRFIYFRVSHKETAEDLVSVIFEKAVKHIDRFSKQEGATPRSWLFTIARNTLIDHYRSQKYIEPLDDHTDLTDESHDALLSDIDTQIVMEKVFEVIPQLSPRGQELILLRFQADFSNKEISQITGLHEKVVASGISKAIRRLQQLIIESKQQPSIEESLL